MASGVVLSPVISVCCKCWLSHLTVNHRNAYQVLWSRVGTLLNLVLLNHSDIGDFLLWIRGNLSFVDRQANSVPETEVQRERLKEKEEGKRQRKERAEIETPMQTCLLLKQSFFFPWITARLLKIIFLFHFPNSMLFTSSRWPFNRII